jgi:hypothetical protein
MIKVYITEKCKQELEVKIKKLEENIHKSSFNASTLVAQEIGIYKELLKGAKVLPIYKSLGEAMQNKDLNNSKGVIITNE